MVVDGFELIGYLCIDWFEDGFVEEKIMVSYCCYDIVYCIIVMVVFGWFEVVLGSFVVVWFWGWGFGLGIKKVIGMCFLGFWVWSWW